MKPSDKLLAKKYDNLKSHIGADLVNRVDKLHEKYAIRGMAIGTGVGVAGGTVISYITNLQNGSDPLPIEHWLLTGFFGSVLGMNLGVATGLTMERYAVKRLAKQHPEKAEAIKAYNEFNVSSTPIGGRRAPPPELGDEWINPTDQYRQQE